MAAGKPLIGSLNGVGGQVIGEANCGFHTKAEDAEGLAQSIQKMSEISEEARTQMGHQAREYFLKNYQKNHVIKLILGHLERHI